MSCQILATLTHSHAYLVYNLHTRSVACQLPLDVKVVQATGNDWSTPAPITHCCCAKGAGLLQKRSAQQMQLITTAHNDGSAHAILGQNCGRH
mmetsp:Transcript_9336/g.16522  ORF Transcript_9336/g.16522 Transcript_9336/m.16522 type:complete len:93 (+) Transcript_9336:333-611(+)